VKSFACVVLVYWCPCEIGVQPCCLAILCIANGTLQGVSHLACQYCLAVYTVCCYEIAHSILIRTRSRCRKRTFGSLGLLVHRSLATWLLDKVHGTRSSASCTTVCSCTQTHPDPTTCQQGAAADWDVIRLLQDRENLQVWVACDSLVYHFGMRAASNGMNSCKSVVLRKISGEAG